jgi:large subunit ribosomal protein L31
MKKGIHPQYHPIKVVQTDGSEYITQMSWGEPGARLQLVIDPKNHPAYTGERKIVDPMGRMEKFRMKYGQATKPAGTEAK